MGEFFLSLGGNMGDTMGYFQFALQELKKMTKDKIIVSPIYCSKSWGFDAEQDFLNCCLILSVDLNQDDFLQQLKKIEKDAGRLKKSTANRYASRVLDLDIIYYGDKVVQTEELIIPHPERLNRNFVLAPLADIAPDFIDPIERVSIKLLKTRCSDTLELRKTLFKLE